MYFLMTNDVETTSLELNKPADFMVKKIKKTGMPNLIELYSKYDVESTFFFTAHITKLAPELIDIAKESGHEIGCHGYKHEPEFFFDNLSSENQQKYIDRSKKIIEKEANRDIYSFRAPENRINEDTIKALEKSGFKYDSSICPQRFDGLLSRGFRYKLRWMAAPRQPYHPSEESFSKRGSSKILEIPISAMIFPFIGTTMRVAPRVNNMLRKYIFYDARKRDIPVVFLFHPTEVIELDQKLIQSNAEIQGNYFSGVVRKRMKYKNLGKKALRLIEGILREAKGLDMEFLSISNYVSKSGAGK